MQSEYLVHNMSTSRKQLADNGNDFPRQEPVAIIGMACRFPGSNGLSGFWRQLMAGENAVIEGPPGSVIGRMGQFPPNSDVKSEALRYGAHLQDIDKFDAEFFRISPVEAQLLDPQQRMMLETSWLALEEAGISPENLRDSRTGIYAGISIYDYREATIDAAETAEAAAGLYAVTGTALNTAIGRVSYTLGLEGPALAIDTACSSSLVAVQQAIGGLERRETDLALAGGVNVHLSGRHLDLRANAGMLSPTGQCHTFDASADGFVCGEGCGLVVLKLLSRAEADGDRIWAVIRGTSVNQDGASQGLMVPSGAAQVRAIEEALSRAGVAPSEIDYLEAHGTGTVVGDPIEVAAAAEVYRRGRDPEHPVLIGSVKTNIGHLGPAAGVAGLIKTVLGISHGVIPRHLNFRNPNPRIDWDNLPVRVTDAITAWPAHPGRAHLAAVNSFGWSGTNAHVVVEGYGTPNVDPSYRVVSFPKGPALPVSDSPQPDGELEVRKTRFLPLSGKTPGALKDLTASYLQWLDEKEVDPSVDFAASGPDLSDMAWTAATGRSHFPYRAGITFNDATGLIDELQALSEREDWQNGELHHTTRVAFVFTGQGSQWPGMGRALYEREPVFRSVLDRCDRLILRERGVSLLDVMFGRPGTEDLLDKPAWTQPAIYALESALAALWESVGIRPDIVVGHSLGEIAASRVAGGFTLEEGLRYAAVRGELLGATRDDGAMAAVFAPASQVESIVADHNSTSSDVGLSVAVDNGPQQVLSGPVEDLEAVLELLEAQRVDVVRLRRSPAYHSALVDPALDELEAAVRNIVPSPPALSTPLISNITGRVLHQGERMDAPYWRQHARSPVAFRSCVETMAEMGVEVVVELGPHAVLGPVVSMSWPESASIEPPVVLASLRRPRRDSKGPALDTSGGFVEAIAGAYEAGVDLDFAGLFAGERRRRVSLPGYPFQRGRHWVQMRKRRRGSSDHPLMGIRHELPRGEVTFETEMFPSEPAWLLDHLVFGEVVAPGGMYGAMAVSAFLNDRVGTVAVDDVQTYHPLIFRVSGQEGHGVEPGRTLQFVLDGPTDAASRRFEIYSKAESEKGWTLHARGFLTSGSDAGENSRPIDLDNLRAELAPADTADFYRTKYSDEISLGPAYRTIRAIWSEGGQALGELALRESVDQGGLELHPLLLDGCFQVFSLARSLSGVGQNAVYMPFGWERLWVTGPMPERIVCHAVLRNPPSSDGNDNVSAVPPEVVTGDISFYSLDGFPLGGLIGYTVKRATRTALLAASDSVKDLLYEVVWRDKPLPLQAESSDLLSSPSSVATQARPLADYLTDEGVGAHDRMEFLMDQEGLSQAYVLSALERLGWKRRAGSTVSAEDLRCRLKVTGEHRRLFGRLLELLSEAGILTPAGGSFVVEVDASTPLPDPKLGDPESLATELLSKHPHGINELGLLHRCGSALAEVLQGRADPLSLLFGDEDAGAAELYLKAPASLAANKMLGDSVSAALSAFPEGRRLRVLEVGAGTGSATDAVLKSLPFGLFDYTYTDISAGFFARAEERLSATGASIEYRTLDIEAAPVAQGFDSHGYDLVIAANVLHATRDLGETLAHCRELLAPSGQLIALEILQRRSWQDLTFGLLDGWWRFDDDYRTDSALATADVWQRALADAEFSDVEFLGGHSADTAERLGSSIIIARGPAEVTQLPGLWILAADAGGIAEALAESLASRNQTVVLAGDPAVTGNGTCEIEGVTSTLVNPEHREGWRDLLLELPEDPPLRGVVHLLSLDGHGGSATTRDMAEDVRRGTASALAVIQGLLETGEPPTEGVWFITRGAQAPDHGQIQGDSGQPAGAALWGFGKVISKEAGYLKLRMVDLDPTPNPTETSRLADEILFPDSESFLAYRENSRMAARLVRSESEKGRLSLPTGTDWAICLTESETGVETAVVEPQSTRELRSGEVRIAVEYLGVNLAERPIGNAAAPDNLDTLLDICGKILETAEDVHGLSAGDQVVGMGSGSIGTEMITRSALVASTAVGLDRRSMAGVPFCFVGAKYALEMAELKHGQRVLVHGNGNVGMAAIQIALAAGAEVFVTSSPHVHAYLRDMGVLHIFDSGDETFCEEVLKRTSSRGVDLILNSVVEEDLIQASLPCLKLGGRFVHLSQGSALKQEFIAGLRPDVTFAGLDAAALTEQDPSYVGISLAEIMARIKMGELTPLPHAVWPLAELPLAIEELRSSPNPRKVLLRMPSLVGGGFRNDRTYLVTGGLGGIGCAVARWLSENGAGVIVLNGRREPDPEAEALIRELQEGGADIRVELADVTVSADVDDMLARIEDALPPLGGVIHSVGVLSDGAIENQTWERFEQVLWPKVLGAWHLHRATMGLDLDMFVLFSSITGVLGNAGQANHAAANAYLDQLAAHRRSLGLPAQAIAWGAWSDIGEAAEQRGRIERQLESAGTRWLTPQQGMQALDWLVRQDVTVSTVTSADWTVVSEEPESGTPFLEDLRVSAPRQVREAVEDAPTSDLLAQLRSVSAEQYQDRLTSFIQQELKSVLRMASSPSATVSFFDLGMDSLMAVELRNRINRALSGEYTASNTVVFDFPTASSLADFLAKELGGLSRPASTPRLKPASRPSRVHREEEPVAIVGMACRFPGAPNIGAYWRLLEEGGNAITDGRPDTGNWDAILGDPAAEAIYRRGAFVEGIDQFDTAFFRIAPIEARLMDPQHRMLLETTWQALEDAGIDPEQLKGSRTGVFAGVGGTGYRDLLTSRGQAYSYFGTGEGIAVGRVAFALGLEGPAMPLDLACASSLAAVHQAVAHLQRGEVDMALAGGVNATLSPAISEFLVGMGMLSQSGQCKAFDAAADGYVRGEGCGVVALKRLDDAEADGDRIWGLVLGTAVNQNGTNAKLMAPAGPAQERAMGDALARAGVLPSDVDYIEAHGVGSEFGDAIEINAIGNVYGKERDFERPLLVGSVKTNIGHLEWASGIAGLIKAVLAMRRGVIPRHLHFTDPNPLVDWDRLPIRISSQADRWPSADGRPALAAVNAYGLSGTNAHIILGGYLGSNTEGNGWPVGAPQKATVDGLVSDPSTDGSDYNARVTRLLPLSGKSPEALQDLVELYSSHLNEALEGLQSAADETPPLLADLAWTAGVGRSHFGYRAGVVFRGVSQLRQRLDELVGKVQRTANGQVNAQLPEPTKVALVYTGNAGPWLHMGQYLYQTEPVFREVLDRCNEQLIEEQGVTFLDAILERGGDADENSGTYSLRAAIYAMECGLTALWKNLGVVPVAVAGHGLGKITAAHVSGAVTLYDGLRLVVAQDESVPTQGYAGAMMTREGSSNVSTGLDISPLSVALINGSDGCAVQPGGVLDDSYWSAGQGRPYSLCANTMADLEIGALIEMGPSSDFGEGIRKSWMKLESTEKHLLIPELVPSFGHPSGDTNPDLTTVFVEAVAKAYEAGLSINFAGLFAGESRQRIPLPGYPFQRRRYWVDPPGAE